MKAEIKSKLRDKESKITLAPPTLQDLKANVCLGYQAKLPKCTISLSY